MSILIITINMASAAKSTTNARASDARAKTHWCMSQLCITLNKQGYDIVGFQFCKFGPTCYNAHKEEDIEKKPLIALWDRIKDFSTFDLGAMMDNILETMDKSKQMVNNPKYRSGMANIHSLGFPELLAFWFDIACHHRRIAKELPSKKKWHDKSLPMPIEEYHYQEDVPQFYLENEDNAWALERVLHMCPDHMKLTKTRRLNMSEICGGAFNCKKGVHKMEEVVCVENLINGECKCMCEEEIEMTRHQIESDIEKLYTMLETSVDADGFQIKLSKKIKDNIHAEIRDKKQELASIPPRMRHLTELGLIPLKVHLEKKREIAKKVEAAVEEIVVTKKVLKKKYT
jgi:hypothetical protein